MERRTLGVLLAGAAAFVNLYAPHSLLPLLRGWMGASAALTGLTISAGTLGVALAAPFAGRIADRLGRRRVIVSAAFAALFPTLLMAAAATPAQLIAARFAEGLLLPFVFAVTVAYTGEEWPPAQARAVLGLYVAGTIGGGFCGRFLAGVVAEFAGWRAAFVALAISQLLVACAIRELLPPERQRRASPASTVSTRTLLINPVLASTFAAGFATLFALVAGFTYVTLHLAQAPYRLGPAALSAIFAVYLIGMVVTPGAGRLLNTLGHTRLLAGAWGVAIAGLGLTLLPALPAVILGLCLFSVGLFLVQTTATSFVGEAAPAGARGAAVGLYVTFYYLGGTCGGVLPAPIWDQAGWAGVAAFIALAGAASTALAGWAFRRAPHAATRLAVSRI